MTKKLLLFSSLLFLAIRCNTQSILIYGGKNHEIFLGCINCNKFDNASIWNTYGQYGSKYNSKSIWNKYGEFGGKYNDFSPFNSYASNPPVLVNKQGDFYGYFTSNKYHDKRADYKLAIFIVDYWEAIMEDVSGYYDKIFR